MTVWKGRAHTVSTALIVLGLTALAFVLVNLAAFAFIQWSREEIFATEDDILSYALYPHGSDGREALRAAFDTPMASRIEAAYENAQSLSFAPHPVLHYIWQPMKITHYTIGREGIRYINGWTDDKVTELLSSAKTKVFLMGGSTTFGYGVDDDDTIAAYLQRQLGDRFAVFNFGTGAYDQVREIDRLLYHLRQGHRPDVVIFLDGVNDSFTFARSNYRLGDKLIYHGFVAGRGSLLRSDRAFGLDMQQSVSANDFMIMLAYSLPITRVLLERTRPRPSIDSVAAVIDSFDAPLDYGTAAYVFGNWATFAERHRELLKTQAREYYQRNLEFLHRLAEAFHFKLLVFYQPNGLLDSFNPMRGPVPPSALGHRYLIEVQETVRSAVRNEGLPMIDITDILSDLSQAKHAYIDAEHYSPLANEEIARSYSKHITGGARPIPVSN